MGEPQEEIWVFGGTRINQGKRVHAWLPVADLGEPDPVLLYAAKGSHAVGSEYRVKVVRGETAITRYGTPEFYRRHGDDALRARLEAAHAVAERVLRVKATERKAKDDSALDAILAPLLESIADASPFSREVFALYVFRRIMAGR
jgi:hypothetical protein